LSSWSHHVGVVEAPSLVSAETRCVPTALATSLPSRASSVKRKVWSLRRKCQNDGRSLLLA